MLSSYTIPILAAITRVSPASCSLPMRKPAKPNKDKDRKKAQQTVGITRYVPYIPPSLVSDTVGALKDRESLAAVLDLVCSPVAPAESSEDRALFQRVAEAYRTYQEAQNERYLERELQIRGNVLEAIHNLPEHLYDEAVRSESEHMPETLTFQHAFRVQLVESELSDFEIEKLDAYRLLMYLRFPYLDVKAKQPGLFWLEEKKAISRQKQASLLARKKKVR
ncbi:hypothetical protein, conserved [Babesia bigemina]|uniref:Uncharacterized protein n=1 Tax=Babesia bigemina TaxID=5866 RepID=A0A061DB53_BABBI|nr:hypothetical protein, conserved [Babesia bigemina]CDR96144.1 hypothetical protein, conserved [Babesia bigemina]|eukprot:XP_012768330.1 hypothetical protein, conserved [Babesia bigemina]